MFKKVITIASSLFFVSVQADAQMFEEKNFALYSTKDGLSDSRITSLAQDEFGYIWIAAKKGLNRFDGNNFLQFYSDSSRNSLINDDIKQLKWLSKEQLGIATPTGLHIIHPRTLQQRNITVPPGPLQYEYKENNIYGIAGDAEGSIFLLTGSGFYHFNNKDELVFRYDHYKKEGEGKSETPFGRSDGIIMPEKGMFLLATTAGPYIYDITKKDIHPVDETDEPLYRQTAPPGGWIHFMHCSSSNSFSVIKESAKELSWFDLRRKKKYPLQTTLSDLNKLFNWRSKITRLDDSTFIITAMQKGFYLFHFSKQSNKYVIAPELYLPNYLCTSVLLDKNNRLWIGTDRGLLHQKKNAGDLEKINIPAEMNALGRSPDITMMTVASNKIFAGTQGGGIYVFDRGSLQPLKRIDFSKLKGYDYANNINNIISFNDDSIYTSTFGPVVGVNANNYNFREITLPDWDVLHNWSSWQFMSSDKVWYISANKNNRFYYRRANEKHFTQADHTGNHLFNINMPRYITEDPSGNIWFSGHGASRFNIRTQQFDMMLDSFPKIKTTRKEIKCLAIDKKGKMYFGLVENGLVIYDPAQKKFEHITRSDGLPDNTIRAIYLHKNTLWLGTESGLANYDIDTKKISPFGIADDMPEGAFTAYSFFYDSVHGQLYGGFNNTIIRFNPDSLSKNNSPPDFFIETINVAGSDVIYHPSDKVKLSYKHNSIVVNLVSINFEDAYQQQFAYRFVKDGNEPWQEAGSQRSIIFSNLSPGQHRLQLKVFIKNNSWREQVKEILIIIKPPFWQTAWFIILAIAFILLALY
ncbi:MAG TPA: two-component regulator propeller domain-containing protein, partial [Chitinophagaceae bacterium]